MTGAHIKIGKNWHEVTQHALWERCKTEAEYFKILSERQKKGGDYEPLVIDESEDQKQIPGGLGF